MWYIFISTQVYLIAGNTRIQEDSEMKQATIGWIGTGVMGTSMCMNLMNDGCQAYIFNRTKERALPLIEKGAHWCESPAEVAKKCDTVFTIVGYPRDVEEVILGKEGVMAGAKKGATIIDMTTSLPRLALEIYEQAKRRGQLPLQGYCSPFFQTP